MEARDFSVICATLSFPEGPVILGDGKVAVVEIAAGCVSVVDKAGMVSQIAQLGGGPNGAALGPDGALYVVNSGGWTHCTEANGWVRVMEQPPTPGWVDRVDLSSGAVKRIYDRHGDTDLGAPNDIVFRRDGGFYFTDHGKRSGTTLGLGRIFLGHADGRPLIEVAQGLITPNGIGLDADERTLYVAETVTRRLLAFDLEPSGSIAARPWPAPAGARLVAGLADNAQLDSLAIDGAGHICVASFNLCGIWRISPDGSKRAFMPLDDFYATNIAFGGTDRCTAYVTLSSTGRLATVRWPVAGQPLAFEPPLMEVI